jgi:dTDP-4-dehydrorhamnose 3,5-epimerase
VDEPELLRGGVAIDDRGSVAFVNDLNISNFRRVYTVSNHAPGLVRAWHGHRFERKAVMVVSGAALVCAVPVDDWTSPSHDLPIYRHVLDERTPSAVLIPAGYANGFMNLAPHTRVCFFSSSTLEESAADDIRFPSRLWDPWSIEER